MAWEMVAQARVSKDGITGDIWKALDELPKGTEALIRLDGPAIWFWLDMAWAEEAVRAAFKVKGVEATVDDCYAEGGAGYIHIYGSPVAWVPLLQAVAAALVALGILVGLIIITVTVYTLTKEFAKEPEKFIVPILLIGSFVIGGLLLAGRRK